MPVALALSPHLDDAAFSCGGTLAALGEAGWRVVVATLFTASVPDPTGFALACQTDKGLPADLDYMALRREEDGAAAAWLGAETEWLSFREAPHRGYGSAAALFGSVRADDDVAAPLAAAIRALLAQRAPDLILAPQAIGGHVDHVQAVRALDAADAAAPVLWWRDFPYAVRGSRPPEPFATRMAALPERFVSLSETARAKRLAACLAYRSQLGFQFGDSDGLARRLDEAGAAERFRVQGPMPAALEEAFGDAA